MSNEQEKPSGGKPGDGGAYSQQYTHSPLSARVPEKVGRGVMSTGIIVLDSPTEFIVDFLQGLTRPPQIVARVILAPAVMEQFIAALRDNIGKYEAAFGPFPQRPKPPADQRRPTIQEVYDELKMPEEVLSGVYANAMMIGHSPAEFFVDFITRFYPTAAVSCRVYLSALQVPGMHDALGKAMMQYRQRYLNQVPPPPALPPQQGLPEAPQEPPTGGQ